MAIDGLTGIASGVDTSAIVDKLMSVERAGRTKLDLRKAAQTTKGSDLGTIQTKLLALRNAAAGLRDVGTWADKQTVESSSTSITAARTSGAGPGGYSISVTGLARAEQHTYTYSKPAADTTLQIGSVGIPLSAGATIDDAVSAVNGKADSPVYAANVNGQLVLSARTTGETASAFTATGDTLSGEVVRKGADAAYSIDNGQTLYSPTNVVANAIPGITLTLKGTTASPAAITVGSPGPDKEAIKTKAKAFIDAYNDLVKTTRGYTDEQRVASATTADDASKGVLYGDSGLTSMLSQFRQALSNPIAPANGALDTSMDELREFGISTGAATGGIATDDSKMGLLTLDADALDKALDTNPLGVRKMLGGVTGTDGFAQRVENLTKTYTGSGGSLTSRLQQSDSALKSLHDQMTAEDARLASVEARYKAQFAAMETALGNAQSQQAWLTGQIAQLG